MWKGAALTLVRAVLFLAIALPLLAGPLVRSTTSFYDARSKNADQLAVVFLTTIIPSLAVAAAFAGLFPSWRVLRVALPVLALLTLIAWAGLTLWVYLGKFAMLSDIEVRWSVLAATPIGIVAANAIIFLLARARSPRG